MDQFVDNIGSLLHVCFTPSDRPIRQLVARFSFVKGRLPHVILDILLLYSQDYTTSIIYIFELKIRYEVQH